MRETLNWKLSYERRTAGKRSDYLKATCGDYLQHTEISTSSPILRAKTVRSIQRSVSISPNDPYIPSSCAEGAGAEEGKGNVDTRHSVDASSTSGSAAVTEEVLHSNQNADENQEYHGSGPILSAAVVGEEVAVLNEIQKVKEANGAAQDISVSPAPAVEVLNQIATRKMEGEAEQLPSLASDEKVLNENQRQHTRSSSEGSDAPQAVKEKSEEFPDLIELGSSGEIFEKGGSQEGSGQAAQNYLNPNQDSNLEGDEFVAFNQNLVESQQEPPQHLSLKKVCHHDAMAMEEELEPTEVCHDVKEILPRKIFAQASWQMDSDSATTVGPTRIGPQDGYFGLIDRDGLMHILGFLPTPDLARFRASFTGARDVVSSHAALEIMERFPMIRVGVREPALSDMSQRRLTFADPAAGVSSPHYGGFGVLDRPTHALQAMVTSNNCIRRSSVSVHGARFSRRLAANTRGGFVGVGVASNEGRSSMAGLERCNKGVGLVKCEGRALESAFPSLHYLEEFGDLLMSQQKTLPRYLHVSIVGVGRDGLVGACVERWEVSLQPRSGVELKILLFHNHI